MINSEVKIVEITPEVAANLLNKNYPRQRKIRQGHVNFLASAMKKGEFTGNTISLASTNGDDTAMLVNGQHTLMAIAQSGVTLSLPLATYRADSPGELDGIYATMDIGLTRNQSDALSAFGTAEKTGLTPTMLGQVVAAIRNHMAGYPKSGASRIKISPFEAHNLCMEWSPYAKKYEELMGNSSKVIRNRLKVYGVLGVLLPLLRYSTDTDTVEDFIRQTALDDGIRRGDPRKALHIHLITTIYRHSLDHRRRELGSPFALSVATAWAWNRFYAGEDLIEISPSVVKGSKRVNIDTTQYYIHPTQRPSVTMTMEAYKEVQGIKDNKS